MKDNETLLLLPGLLCDAALWQYQTSALAAFCDPVVAELTKHDSIAAMASSVLESAPPRFALAGLSMGGYVVFEILRQAPDRVTRVALIDTQARADTEDSARRRRAMIALAKTGRFKGVTPRLIPQLLHPDHIVSPYTDIVMDMAARVGKDAFVRQQTAILGRVDSRADLSLIKQPSVVICGEKDIVTPPELASEIASGIPGAELVIVDHAGHLAPLEQPQAVNRALIDWLSAD